MAVMKFLGGTSIVQLKQTVHDLLFSKRWVPIIDYAKEACKTSAEVKDYCFHMNLIIKELDDFHKMSLPMAYALKASSFQASPDGKKYMKDLVSTALDKANTIVLLDAEEDALKQYENAVYHDILTEFNKDSVKVYKTYQMYRRDALDMLKMDLDMYEKLGIKLVRGAYMKEDKHVLHKTIMHTHRTYDQALIKCIGMIKHKEKEVKLMVATHNTNSANMAMRLSNDGLKQDVSFAQLLGMGDILSHDLSKQHRLVYKYVPYGNVKEALPYLLRRFKENIQIIRHYL